MMEQGAPRGVSNRLYRLQLELYGLFLVALIVGYYMLAIGLAIELLDMAWSSVTSTAEFSAPVRFTIWGAAGLGLVLAIRLIIHLALGLVGLVTAQNDTAAAEVDGVELVPAKCPELYAAVAEVGARLGTHLPHTIWLVPRPECYALELRRFGILPRRRLVLALGLPQFEVLTIAELKVIIAHELAHFISDTRTAVFVDRFLRSLQSDTATGARRWQRWMDPVCWLMMSYSWGFRLAAAPFLRRQELQADRLSAEAYGGDLASWTLLKMWLLDRQFEFAYTSFQVDHQASDNFFRHFVNNWREFSPAAYQYLRERLAEEEEPTLWDSHPLISQRIEQMSSFTGPPNIAQSPPAHHLLPNLAKLEHALGCELNLDQPLSGELKVGLKAKPKPARPSSNDTAMLAPPALRE